MVGADGDFAMGRLVQAGGLQWDAWCRLLFSFGDALARIKTQRTLSSRRNKVPPDLAKCRRFYTPRIENNSLR